MTNEFVKKLLEAGVHFGHQSKRWNPKMKRFIFGERGGIYIIDLEKTVDNLNRARDFAKDIAAKGGIILFVGTKKQAQDIIEFEANRVGMFYIKHRWMGGLLTNFDTIKKSIKKLGEIEKMCDNGVFARLTKKEIAILTKEKDKLLRDLGGIRSMGKIPDAIFIVDTHKEDLAVKEASKLKIPIIGVIDTNCDPDLIDYPIPGNDDAVKSIKLLVSLVSDSFEEGRKEYLTSESLRKTVETKESGSSNEKVEASSTSSSV